MPDQDAENPVVAAKRADPICGLTRTHGGTEFICINPPHDPHYQRRGEQLPRPGNGGHPARHDGQAPKADRHYFVNRWPNRPRPGSD